MADTIYSATTTTKAGLLAAINDRIDALTKWTASTGGNTASIANTDHTQMMLQITYASASDTILFAMHDGTGYTKEATMTFSNAGVSSQVVNLYSLVNDDRLIFVISTKDANNIYTNNMFYFGRIAAFDADDKHAWGLYVSGAPELMGKNFTNLGIGYGVLECMYIRAVTRFSNDADEPISIMGSDYAKRSTVVTPFTFMDMEGYDGAEYGYNAEGLKTNILTGTPTFGGPNLRDIFEEEKYLASRVIRIGVYKEFDGRDGFGMKGTMDGLYHVKNTWSQDSNKLTVPKTKGMAPTTVSILVSSRGAGFLGSTTNWLVVPLSNRSNTFYIYNGLNVIAIPQLS